MTIYGQVDAAYTSAKSDAPQITALSPNGPNPKVSGLFGAGLGSNFLGFMGTEDLGGGLKANFKLEAQYNPDNGTGAGSNVNNQAVGGANVQFNEDATANTKQYGAARFMNAAPGARASLGGTQGLTFNRWAYVGLSSGTMGELRLGREYTPTFQAILGSDVLGANGAQNTLNMTLAIAGQSANGVSVGTSASNGISYTSPNFNGFGAKVQMIKGENPSNGVADTLNIPKSGDGSSYHLYYNQGAISAGYAALTVKGTAVKGYTNLATGEAYGSLPGDYKQEAMYAKYNAGFALFTAGQVTEKLVSAGADSIKCNDATCSTTATTAAVPGDMKNVNNIIGVSVPYGSWTFGTNYIKSTYSVSGVNKAKGTQLGLQAKYALSKRTDLYANYANVKNEQGSLVTATNGQNYYGLGNGAGRMVTAGASSTAYQFGIRHAF